MGRYGSLIDAMDVNACVCVCVQVFIYLSIYLQYIFCIFSLFYCIIFVLSLKTFSP